MDDARFDHFARTIAGLTSRRGLLGVAAALPVVGSGGLLVADTAAKRRQRRREDRDDVQDEKKKKKKKVTLCLNEQTIRVPKKKKKKFLNQGATPGECPICVPESKATTCNGKCGSQVNNCGQAVDCGSCDCNPVCAECFVCEGTPGTCVPETLGTACGQGPRCVDGQERAQDTCDGSGTCFEDGGQSCRPYLCAGTVCGEPPCSGDGDCDANAFCSGSGECQFLGNDGDGCEADDECFSGQCCSNVCRQCCDSDACTEPTAPVCFNNVCSPCTSDPGNCPGDTCCNATTLQCVETCPQDEVCRETNICGAPCTSGSCNAAELCVEGVCQACDVFNTQDLQTFIDAADAGSTLYVCPGTYLSQVSAFTINKSLTVIGAGDGGGGTLLAHRLDVEVDVNPPDVTLNSMLIQGQGVGINSLQGAKLTMRNCTVSQSGRGIDKTGGSLVMNHCKVLNNTNAPEGAGIRNNNGSVELNDCLIEGNSATTNGGGILTGHQPEETSSLTLNNTVVRGNTATGGIGAGIYRVQSQSTVIISNDSAICENDPLANQCENIKKSRCFAVCPS